ncbi:MAG: BamA/TamA family outer membrane protein [Bacteroidia bacterium]|nr:BamA/TamA family outer membrane protein [Bacteroidia bacterium]
MLILVSLFFQGRAQTDSVKRFRIQPLPSVFHTPETSWGFGATLLGFLNPKDTNTSSSNAQIFLDVTLRRQASFQSDFNLFTKNDKWYFKGSHDLSKFPEFYFGIGNNNEKSDHCLIDIGYFDFKINAYTKLKKDWYIGPRIHFQNLSHINKNIVQEGFSIDDMGYASLGTGIGFLIDKRNDILNPTDGFYLETLISKYFDQSHSTKGYSNQRLDARYYHTFNKLTLNTNLYAVQNQGVVPFRMMPFIGGPRFLRGYYAGRFRDNNLALAQAEIRRNVFWRIGVAAFAGIGQVYDDLSNFRVNHFHYNYGGGLRFQIHKESQANIRFDYGRTKDSHGFYIVFGECF